MNALSRIKKRIFVATLLAGAGAAVLPTSGCSKREDELRNCDVPALFQSSCDGSVCHGSETPRANLDLVSPGVNQRLFHVPATADCDERKLVLPGHPEDSVLYLKVANKDPFCGKRMPIDKELSESELACLKDYIEKAGTDTDGQDCETCGTILCVDFKSNPSHCGGCDSPCDAGKDCGDGTCVDACAEGETLCGATCATLDTNDQHCGSCGHRCGPGSSCEKGVCTCDPGEIGAGGSGSTPAGPSFSGDILPIFENSCSGSDCHTGEDRTAPLALDADVAYANLVGVTADDCSGRDLVVPQSPDQSYLIEKLLGGALCAGDPMPLGDATLPDAAKESFVRWICDGAKDD